MKFVHLLSRITSSHWLIEESALSNIVTLIDSRISGLALSPAAPLPPRPVLRPAPADTAVIPISGVIGKKLSPLEMACGGCDVDELEASFDAANNDPKIARIILAIDSPGGTVSGVPELAGHILETKSKPVEAQSDTLIGSAAYWLACAADSITVTPTARVGSIGAALTVKESTGADKDGARLRIFRSGADKMAGMDGPLSPAQAAHMQAGVDQIGALFRQFVQTSRPNIPAGAMTGHAYFGKEAEYFGLCDAVVNALPYSGGCSASESAVVAFNENHDDAGRFSESPGGGGSPGKESPAPEEKKADKGSKKN